MHHAEGRAVEVAQRVGVLQAREHVREDAHVQPERHAAAPQLAQDDVQRLPVEVVHREEVARAVDADLVGLDHVRVVEARRDARLVHEHREEVLVVLEVALEQLDDEQLVEPAGPGDARQEHRRHAALSELGDDVIFPDAISLHGQCGVGPMRTNEIVLGRTWKLDSPMKASPFAT